MFPMIFTWVSYNVHSQVLVTSFGVFLGRFLFFFQMAIQLPLLIVKKSICSLLIWKNPVDHIIPYVYLSLIWNVYFVYWPTSLLILNSSCLNHRYALYVLTANHSGSLYDSFTELSWILLLILSYKFWNKTFGFWK